MGGGGQPGGSVEVGQVGRHDHGPAAGLVDPGRDVVELGCGPGRDDDVGARLGQRHRGGGADAPARAGDDGDAVGQAEPVLDHGATLLAGDEI